MLHPDCNLLRKNVLPEKFSGKTFVPENVSGKTFLPEVRTSEITGTHLEVRSLLYAREEACAVLVLRAAARGKSAKDAVAALQALRSPLAFRIQKAFLAFIVS